MNDPVITARGKRGKGKRGKQARAVKRAIGGAPVQRQVRREWRA